MKFLGQVAHHDAHVLTDIVASPCFLSFAFANNFGLKVKKGSYTLVLGNGDQVPTGRHIETCVRYNNIILKLIT